MRVLNVGGNNKAIPIPPFFDGWDHVLLDIDPECGADLVCDARELHTLPNAEFDAVYCSHNLEHFYAHEVPKVLAGMAHVLKGDGFVQINVPNIGAMMKHVVEKGLDIDDPLYICPAGPITAKDMLYGHSGIIEASGQPFMGHRTGFTKKSLMAALTDAGFPFLFGCEDTYNLIAYAFKTPPTPETILALGQGSK